MNKTILSLLLLSSVMSFNQPGDNQQSQEQTLSQGQLGQSLIIQTSSQQQVQYNPLEELPYIQPSNPIYPGHIIIQNGAALQEINQSLNTLQVLYFGMFKTDPNIRFFRKPADRLILIISYQLNGQTKYIGYEATYDQLLNQNQQWSFQMVFQSQDRMQVYNTFKIRTQQGSSFNAYRGLSQFFNSNQVFKCVTKCYMKTSHNNLTQVRNNNQYNKVYPTSVFGTVFEYLINTGINYSNLQVLNVSSSQDIYYYVFQMQINRQMKYLGVKLRQRRQMEILSVLIENNLEDLLNFYGLEVYDQSFVQFYNSVSYQSKNLPLWQKLQMTMQSQQYNNQSQMNNQYNQKQYGQQRVQQQYGQQGTQQQYGQQGTQQQYGQQGTQQQNGYQRPQQQQFGQQITVPKQQFKGFGQTTTFLLGSSGPEEVTESQESEQESEENSQ